jgi:hypothetical protein
MYRHTQTGFLTLLIILCAAAFVIWTGRAGDRSVFIPLVVLLFIGLIFSSLTVEVDQKGVRFWFGPGVFRQSISFSEIASFSVVQNPWYWGWGIRFIRGGRLYNVSGRDAVELSLRSGRRVRIGTDEPDALYRAITAFQGPV